MSGLSPNETCARCGGAFHCGAQDTTPCACGQISLTTETIRRLRERYTGCLCLTCLGEMAATQAPPKGEKKPAEP